MEERICFRSHIGPHASGRSLVDFLSKRFTYFSDAQWRKHIEDQDVMVNGALADAERVLIDGDLVQYFAMKKAEPRVPTHIPILYQDEDLLIVNKPAHIPVHPTGRYLRNTLINVLKKQTGLNFLILAHRLDRETSGVCVLSKTPLGKEKMYWAFFKGDLEKTYWALVWGRPNPPSGLVDAPLGLARPDQSRIRIKQVVGGIEAKSARTKYHTLGTKWIQSPTWTPPPWPGLVAMTEGKPAGTWPVSLVECRPLTGRTNQIRVHLTQVGCGVMGDKLYDPDERIFMEFKDAQPMLDEGPAPKGRQSEVFIKMSDSLKRRLTLDAHALHARSLKFRHPRTQKLMTVEAPPPRSWQGLYDKP